MKITLIKPNIGKIANDQFYVDEGRMEPLQLGVLAALTPNDIEIKMYDDRIEQIPYNENTDLVAITVETFTAKRSYEISRKYRDQGIPVVMGGMHPTLIPNEVTQFANSVIIGDAEGIWGTVIHDAKEGKLKPVYKGQMGIPHPGIFTRRDIFKNKGYLPISLMQFSRGCQYKCKFCATSAFFKSKHYCRVIDEVIQEIVEQNLKTIFFVDDNIVSHKKKAKELFKALIPLKVRWVSQASLDMLDDIELMELMVLSGCMGNVIGFESLNKENLKRMNKSANLLNYNDQFKSQVEILRSYGLQSWAAFTLGYDNDTEDSIKRTLEFAIKNKFTFAAFNILMPYPSTLFYEELKSANRLLYDGKWWLHPDYRFNYAAFIPKNLSSHKLTDLTYKARKEFNSVHSIIKRMFDFKTNMRSFVKLLVYLTYNPLFKKEVHKKQGMIFGINN